MTAITHGSLGSGTSLIGTAASTTIANKSLVASSGIGISSSSTEVTIGVDTPYCRVTDNTGPTITNGSAPTLTWNTNQFDPTGMHSTSVNTDRINIAVTGLYSVNVILQVSWSVTPTGPVFVTIRQNGATVVGANGFMPANAQVNSFSTIYPFTAADYVTVVFSNNSGQTLTLVNAAQYSPTFSACYIGEL